MSEFDKYGPPFDGDPQAGGPAMSLDEVLAIYRKQLAGALAEGFREGIEAAARVCDAVVAEFISGMATGPWSPGIIAARIRALLPPAGLKDPSSPVDGGESGKVGG